MTKETSGSSKSALRQFLVLQALAESNSSVPLTLVDFKSIVKEKAGKLGCDTKIDDRTLRGILDRCATVFPDNVVINKKEGSPTCWHWRGDTRFRTPKLVLERGEARYLADSLVSARRINTNQRKTLIDKLIGSSRDLRVSWDGICPVSDLFVPPLDNDQFFDNVEKLLKWIKAGFRISFTHGEADANGRIAPSGKRHTVDPYFLTSYEGNYYLIALYPRLNTASTGERKLYHFRVDFIFDVEIASDGDGDPIPIQPLEEIEGFEKFNLQHYLAAHPYMHSDPIVESIVSIENTPVARHHLFQTFGFCRLHPNHDGGGANDADGKALFYKVKGNKHAIVSWACQFADEAEIHEPKELRTQMLDIARRMVEKYASTDADMGDGAGFGVDEDAAADSVVNEATSRTGD